MDERRKRRFVSVFLSTVIVAIFLSGSNDIKLGYVVTKNN